MMESLKEAVEKFLEECIRCILTEVSVKISEGIMGGILEAFRGTKHETITIRTLQDAHGRIHKGETPEEMPCRISETITERVPE